MLGKLFMTPWQLKPLPVWFFTADECRWIKYHLDLTTQKVLHSLLSSSGSILLLSLDLFPVVADLYQINQNKSSISNCCQNSSTIQKVKVIVVGKLLLLRAQAKSCRQVTAQLVAPWDSCAILMSSSTYRSQQIPPGSLTNVTL